MLSVEQRSAVLITQLIVSSPHITCNDTFSRMVDDGAYKCPDSMYYGVGNPGTQHVLTAVCMLQFIYDYTNSGFHLCAKVAQFSEMHLEEQQSPHNNRWSIEHPATKEMMRNVITQMPITSQVDSVLPGMP